MSQQRRFIVSLAEGLDLRYELASPLARGAALFVDSAVLGLAASLLKPLAEALGLLGEGVGAAAYIIGFFAFSTCYGFLCEWLWRGQTVGKRALSLRVMDAQGRPLAFQQAALRNLLRNVDRLPALYGLGALVSYLQPQGQRLGDLAAGTVVVRERRSPSPDWSALAAGRFNSLKGHKRICARLRQACSAEEAELALELLQRRDELDDDVRLRLFAVMAERLRAKAGAPPELTEALSDEQWLRAVVDVLYQASREETGKPSAGDASVRL